jgi:Carboxypeptidase regulatory-like domain
MRFSASCKNFRTSSVLLLLLFASFATVPAQVPTGAIRGVVADPTGAVIAGATVIAKNKNTGAERVATTQADGQYQISNLLPGEYELSVAMTGFKKHLSSVTVEVGDTSTANRSLEVGEASETVVVSGDATGLVNTSDYKIDGVITRQKIDSLPLNGRNFLTLAALEPGVRIGVGSPGDTNNLVNVSVGGAQSALTRLTVDGGSIVDGVTGGAGQNFSIESVQEFQISSFNFDLSTGVTSVGAVNIVTRTGTNDFHGSAFAFFRDRNIAAYPLLSRSAQTPDPFFRRLQSGFSVGGPIKKEKVFFFFNLENLNQDSVFATTNRGFTIPGTNITPLSQLDTVAASPYDQLLTNARVDYRHSPAHNFFLRYSGDVSDAFGPVIDAFPNNFIYSPSNWRKNRNDAYGGQGGWTWTPRSDLVNDLRFNWTYGGNKSLIPTASDCPGCLGLNGPQIRINNTNFRIGNHVQAPQNRALHRYETTNITSYTKGSHLSKFGLTWEKGYGTGNWNFIDPAVLVLHNPADVLTLNATLDRFANPATIAGLLAGTPQAGLAPIFTAQIQAVAPQLRIPLPASFTTPGATITYQDLLALPVAGGAVGIGDGAQPPPFRGEIARNSQRFRLFGQDSWRVRQGLTLNYGLTYTYETNLYNHDLQKPGLLSSLYGTTNPNPRDRNNVAPAVGFAWDVKNNAKTVIRGGFGMFYDTSLFVNRLTERALIGPLGNGRVQTTGDFFRNSIVDPTRFPQATQEQRDLVALGVAQLVMAANAVRSTDPVRAAQLDQFAGFLPALFLINPAPGAPLSFQIVPTKFTANDFLNVIQQQIPLIQQQLSALGNQGVQGLDFFKLAAGNGVLIDPFAELPYSLQFSIGVQREMPWNMLLSADFVSRNRVNTFFQADRNLFYNASGPVIPQCTSAQATDPTALCTNGPVSVLSTNGREQYKGLLVKLDKRFAKRYAFTAAYTFSSAKGFDYARDLTNWFGNPGPLTTDARHLFSFNGLVDLPRGFQAGFIANLASRSPFSVVLPVVSDSDINSDGTNNDNLLLPGFGWNQGNRDISESELQGLVDAYNMNIAGTMTPSGDIYPVVSLPSSFGFGDLFQSYDARLSKIFKYRERMSLELIGEVFNMFNISNLTNFDPTLNNNTFGQATARAGQGFGFGGPRAFQFAARFKF